jgi:hypothetical protein
VALVVIWDKALLGRKIRVALWVGEERNGNGVNGRYE